MNQMEDAAATQYQVGRIPRFCIIIVKYSAAIRIATPPDTLPPILACPYKVNYETNALLRRSPKRLRTASRPWWKRKAARRATILTYARKNTFLNFYICTRAPIKERNRRNINKEKGRVRNKKHVTEKRTKTKQQKNTQNNTKRQVKLHHLKRERVVDNGESRRMHFLSREILRAFGRDDESIQPKRWSLGWGSCQQPCH